MPLYFVTFSQQLSKASCLIAEAFYSLGAGACKMAAEQPFLQNESSGLPPACKPKLQQAGVYYLVYFDVGNARFPYEPLLHHVQM